jgi:NADPH:quinone reductase-like Zn-dependent oxidoreductase
LEVVPQPKPGNDEVLVRVHAASINPVDAAIMAGSMSFMTTAPLTLGTDFSGKVVEAGKGVTHVKPGDAVFGLIPMGSGTFSEYATPKAGQMALRPKSLDYICFDHSLTIHDGLAAQFAKSKGAFVYGTDIPEKAQHVAGLGIDRFIDVKSERFEEVVKDVDIVLDYIGGEFMERSYSVLKAGGRFVTALALQTPQEEAEKRGFSSTGFGAQIAELVDAGKLKVFVNRTFPLAEAQAALEYRFVTKAPGKIVPTIL